MAFEQLNESLSYCAGGADNAYWNLVCHVLGF
jgi:hypothetical protein